jgi:glycerophosphoryl diester phosphodiesterase
VLITTTYGRVLACLVATAASPCPAGGQASACTGGQVLPAYAHNDYANPHPLSDALELGFRGVEADVLLRGGELRVAHDASAARPGRNLEALYLRPLRTIVQQCGHVLAPSTPFLLNVELKERSRPAYDSLLALLERYVDLFEPRLADGAGPPVEIILVGWYPPAEHSTPDLQYQLWRQQRITTLSRDSGTQSRAVRLVSLDYGKTIGWSGRGPPPERAASWLARLRAAKGEGAGRLVRAYNVPVDPAVYRLLLEAGVDLIGTKRLSAAQQVLLTVGAASLR